MLDLSKFNESQLKAVNWENGNLLVLSGRGAGKSRSLAYRIARHSLENSYDVLPFLGLTFSNKATNIVMAEVHSLLSETRFAYRKIDTEILRFFPFHAYAERLLQMRARYINRESVFTILTHEHDRLLLLNEAIESEFPRHSEIKSENLLPLINRLIENDVAPGSAAEYIESRSYSNPEIPARIYQTYRSMMSKYNVYDNPSMISDAIRLFEIRPEDLGTKSGAYPFLCVDEFHNITYAQYKLFRKMMQPEFHNLFIMADDRMVFDQWDGENINRLEAVQQDFGMKLCRLPDNHHCADEIARTGNKLTTCNFVNGEAADPIGTFEWNEASSSIGFQQFEEFSDEIDWITSSVSELDADSQSKCAVLAGSKILLEHIAESLKEHGVNGYLPYGKGNFESYHMIWFVSVLKLAVSRTDSRCLQQVCKSFDTLCGISINYKDVIPHAKTEGVDYLRSWADAVLNREETDAETRSMITDSLMPDLLDSLDFQKFQESAFKWLNELEFTNSEPRQIRENFSEEKAHWGELVEEISDKQDGQRITLNTLIREFKGFLTPPAQPDDAVSCLKLSEIVGSGFDRVYVAGMTEGQSPSWESIAKGDSSREMQEDRRNFVAAITSTGKTLTMTCSRLLDGQQSRPSRFLNEMGILDRDSWEVYEPEYEEKMVATG